MSQKTVQNQPVGSGAVRSVTGNLFDFLNNAGSTISNLAGKYIDLKSYKDSKQVTSAVQPISSDPDAKQVVSKPSEVVSTNQILLVGGGVTIGALMFYLLLKKK